MILSSKYGIVKLIRIALQCASLHISIKVCDNKIKIMIKFEQPKIEQEDVYKMPHLRLVDESFQPPVAEIQEKPFATPEEMEEIRSALKGKEGWKEVDFRLEAATIEWRRLEKGASTDESENRIKELRKEIDTLKEVKSPSPKKQRRVTRGGLGGRPNKQERAELSESIDQALKEDSTTRPELPPLEFTMDYKAPREGGFYDNVEIPETIGVKQAVLKEEPTSSPESGVEKTWKSKSPEELTALQEKLSKMLGKAEKEVGARSEKAGPEAMSAVRKVGEAWKKVPPLYKFAIAGSLILSGLGAVAAGSTAAIAGVGLASAAIRALGMASMFVGFEKMFETYHEKKNNEPLTESELKRNRILAMTLTASIGLLMPQALSAYFDVESLSVHETLSPGESIVPFESFPNSTPKIESVVENGDTQLPPNIMHNAEMLPTDKIASIEHLAVVTSEISPIVPDYSVSAPTEPTFIDQTVGRPDMGIPEEVMTQAVDHALKSDINELFGAKGFFGFLSHDGVDSLDWKDSEIGFANLSVDKILTAHPSALSEGVTHQFGIEDYSATTKMQEYLLKLVTTTGVTPLLNESTQNYIARVIDVDGDVISKIMNSRK